MNVKNKFIKGDIVQYNPTTRTLRYVVNGQTKTVVLDKDEAARYVKYFMKCSKGLALDYLVSKHFKTDEETYRVLSLSSRTFGPDESQKIIKDIKKKIERMLELLDGATKKQISPVISVVKSMLNNSNLGRVSIIRDIFFPELQGESGLKSTLENKTEITEFKSKYINTMKYTTYIDDTYEQDGLIKVLKEDGPNKTYTFFAAMVCLSILKNSKVEGEDKQKKRIEKNILSVFLATNSNIVVKNVCGSLYFPLTLTDDYFITSMQRAYGISSTVVDKFLRANFDPEQLTGVFTSAIDTILDFEWFIPLREDYITKQQTKYGNMRADQIKTSFDFIYLFQNQITEQDADLLSGSKALAYMESNNYKETIKFEDWFNNPNNKRIAEKFKIPLKWAIDNKMTFNLNTRAVPLLNILTYVDAEDVRIGTMTDFYLPGLLSIVRDKGEHNEGEIVRAINDKADYIDFSAILSLDVNGEIFKIYEGDTFYVDNYWEWAEGFKTRQGSNKKHEAERDDRADMTRSFNNIINNFAKWAKLEDRDVKKEEAVSKLKSMLKGAHIDTINNEYYKKLYDDYINNHFTEDGRYLSKKLTERFQVHNNMKNIESTIKQVINSVGSEQVADDDKKKRILNILTNKYKIDKVLGKNLIENNYERIKREPPATIKITYKDTEKLAKPEVEEDKKEDDDYDDMTKAPSQDKVKDMIAEAKEEISQPSTLQGLSNRQLKKCGLKPWQIKKIKKQAKGGMSELETLNEIKSLLEVLITGNNTKPEPLDKTVLPIQPPVVADKVMKEANKVADVPLLLGKDLNEQRKKLRHIKPTKAPVIEDKNTLDWQIRHFDKSKLNKTLKGLEKLMTKGTIAKSGKYVKIHPITAHLIKAAGCGCNLKTYKGGVFSTLASVIPYGSQIYNIAKKVYNAAKPLVEKAISKYDESYNKHMKSGYLSTEQLKSYLVKNEKPQLRELNKYLK